MILPGQTIGILGGGQLGRMFTIAARRMGYRVHALDPTSDSPTGQVADFEVIAAYDDIDAARRFAFGVDVVTFEFENVPAETLAAIEQIRPVHPSPQVLDTCRHRLREKDFLSKKGFPVTTYRAIKSADDLRAGLVAFRNRAILKTADFGYDGKGQTKVDRADIDADEIWSRLGRPTGILEAIVDFEREISVICGRTESGETRCFRPFENAHRNHILDVTSSPASISQGIEQEAIQLAIAVAESLKVVGVIAVEMFVTRDEKLLVNELAPRPHNSGHLTIDACVTSQFEQQLRAVCELPLGDVTMFHPAAMANLLGDLWKDHEPDWGAALRDPRVKLHLYGKQTPKPGRKMGHLTATAQTVDEARRLVVAARDSLSRAGRGLG